MSAAMRNELNIFGENTAVGMVMTALTAEDVGTIMHCNIEFSRILGYKRKELLGQKVNMI